MLLTTGVIEESLKGYSNTGCKLGRLVRDGTYHPVIRGLYETDPGVPAYQLAQEVCSPSYISFEWALGYHGMIPESVTAVTCASCGKRRDKVFETGFGRLMYTDIPSRVFHLGVEPHREGDRVFWVATREKALCDMLYKTSPLGGLSGLEDYLYDDLRLYEEDLLGLDTEDVAVLAERYRCRNVGLLGRWLVRA